MFSVLVADGIEERTQNFRILGKGYRIKLVSNITDVIKAIQDPAGTKWDVVFLSGFFGAWRESLSCILKAIIEQKRVGKVRSVVMTGLIEKDMIDAVKVLRSGGVPAAWIPYNYDNPSRHVRREVK